MAVAPKQLLSQWALQAAKKGVATCTAAWVLDCAHYVCALTGNWSISERERFNTKTMTGYISCTSSMTHSCYIDYWMVWIPKQGLITLLARLPELDDLCYTQRWVEVVWLPKRGLMVKSVLWWHRQADGRENVSKTWKIGAYMYVVQLWIQHFSFAV